jgi:hypothetical protein
MCCNTKPGPKAALAFFKEQTGVHVTQADWHKIRKAAEHELGRPLRNNIVDSKEAGEVAAKLADSLDASAMEKRAFIFSFAKQRNTDGNVQAVGFMASHGLPSEVTDKKARTSAAQLEETPVKLVDESDAPEWGVSPLPKLSDQEFSEWAEGERRLRATDKPFTVRVTTENGESTHTIWAASPVQAMTVAEDYYTEILETESADAHAEPAAEGTYEHILSDEEIEYLEYLDGGARNEEGPYEDDSFLSEDGIVEYDSDLIEPFDEEVEETPLASKSKKKSKSKKSSGVVTSTAMSDEKVQHVQGLRGSSAASKHKNKSKYDRKSDKDSFNKKGYDY